VSINILKKIATLTIRQFFDNLAYFVTVNFVTFEF